MSYPSGWDLVNITGTYIDRTGTPCVGSVTLSSPQLVLRSGTIVPAADIIFTLVNGAFSGKIPATDDPNASPIGWTYTVTENVPGGRQGYQIVAPHTSPGIDLSTVVPVTMPQPPTYGFPYVTLAQLASTATGQGIALIGWPAGFGITQASTNQFFEQNGAAIHRFNDRIFLAGATICSGDYPQTTNDWLSAFYNANGYTSYTLGGQLAVLNNSSGSASQAIVAGVQTLDFTSSGASGIGGYFVGVNNNATLNTYAWGLYVEGQRLNATVGSAYAVEFDVRNMGNSVNSDPYGQGAGAVIGVQIGAGAGVAATGQANCSAAINIVPNPMKFNAGIIVASGSINGNAAIALAGNADGHAIQWYGANSTPISNIRCTGSTSANAASILFREGAIDFTSGPSGDSGIALTLATNSSGVNNFYLTGANAGSAPSLRAVGSDTNIDVVIQPKGSGLIKMAYNVTTASVPANFTANHTLAIKDGSGTTYFVPCDSAGW